jgi:predicted aminopeptidase
MSMDRIVANARASRPRGVGAGDRAGARVAAFVARGALLLAAWAPLSGCYLTQAAVGQGRVLAASEPVDALLADPATPDRLRERLELLDEARRFAIDELGLPDGRSYRRYADLGRPYAIWNVVAAPEFSVEPRRWCYPIAGCVAYRGYFAEDRARAAAARLERRGDDVTVGGVSTYSTLGRLPDPLFSTMLDWGEARFVGTVFHELAHERLYVPDDSSFNEAFASVVERAGVRQWLEQRGRSAELAAWEAARAREADFARLLRTARERLARLYASGVPPSTLALDKQRELGRLKFEYTQLRARWGGYAGYDPWFARTLNNAHLAAVATYHDCVPGLERELAAAGSLAAFYARTAELAQLPPAERRAAVCGPAPSGP